MSTIIILTLIFVLVENIYLITLATDSVRFAIILHTYSIQEKMCK